MIDNPAPDTGPASAPPPSSPIGPVRPEKEAPKTVLLRAFSLNIGQALRLLGLSTLVGFFVLAFDYKPSGATLDVGGAFTAIVQRALTAIGWAFESFWKPAVAGALVVMPLWAIWRLIRLPFRK